MAEVSEYTEISNAAPHSLDKYLAPYYCRNTEVYMTTVRLPIEYEQKLDMLSVLKQKNKSELIKDALDIFFHQEEIEVNSYELGKDYFGKYGSGRTDLSTTYKQELKERLHAKYGSH